jgi:hypothetical protein
MHPAFVPFTNKEGFFMCWEPGCARYFSRAHGYFSLHLDQIEEGTRVANECSKPECKRIPAYMGVIRDEGTTKWWRCFNCDATVENPAL